MQKLIAAKSDSFTVIGLPMHEYWFYGDNCMTAICFFKVHVTVEFQISFTCMLILRFSYVLNELDRYWYFCLIFELQNNTGLLQCCLQNYFAVGPGCVTEKMVQCKVSRPHWWSWSIGLVPDDTVTFVSWWKINEPGHEKMYLMPYANNKGTDKLAHPRSLISAFVVAAKTEWYL